MILNNNVTAPMTFDWQWKIFASIQSRASRQCIEIKRLTFTFVRMRFEWSTPTQSVHFFLLVELPNKEKTTGRRKGRLEVNVWHILNVFIYSDTLLLASLLLRLIDSSWLRAFFHESFMVPCVYYGVWTSWLIRIVKWPWGNDCKKRRSGISDDFFARCCCPQSPAKLQRQFRCSMFGGQNLYLFSVFPAIFSRFVTHWRAGAGVFNFIAS